MTRGLPALETPLVGIHYISLLVIILYISQLVNVRYISLLVNIHYISQLVNIHYMSQLVNIHYISLLDGRDGGQGEGRGELANESPAFSFYVDNIWHIKKICLNHRNVTLVKSSILSFFLFSTTLNKLTFP